MEEMNRLDRLYCLSEMIDHANAFVNEEITKEQNKMIDKDKITKQVRGSFNTANIEKYVTEKALRELGAEPGDVHKCRSRDTADIIFSVGNRFYTAELKYEGADRWSKYGDYGFEGGVWDNDNHQTKPSKAEYSGADLWIFYTWDNGDYKVLGVYDFLINRDAFLEAQKNSPWTWTRSKNYESGKVDTWIGRVYFVNPSKIEEYKVRSFDEFIKNRDEYVEKQLLEAYAEYKSKRSE